MLFQLDNRASRNCRFPQKIPFATGALCEIGRALFSRMSPSYEPPFTVTTRVLDLVVRINEEIGPQGGAREASVTPALRRGNRLPSAQASRPMGMAQSAATKATKAVGADYKSAVLGQEDAHSR